MQCHDFSSQFMSAERWEWWPLTPFWVQHLRGGTRSTVGALIGQGHWTSERGRGMWLDRELCAEHRMQVKTRDTHTAWTDIERGAGWDERDGWMERRKERWGERCLRACVSLCVCAQQKSPDSSVSRALSVTHPSSWLIGSLPSLSLLLSPSLSLTLSLYLPPTILLSFPRLPSLSPSIRRCS